MARPPKLRRVEFIPEITYFKPAGVPLRQLEEVVLAVEELEAIRLRDMECLEQEDCAARMGISRPTFFRILNAARSKIAEALIVGKSIRVEGGCYRLATRKIHCRRCDYEWEPEPEATTFCPQCGNKKQAETDVRSGRSRRRRQGRQGNGE